MSYVIPGKLVWQETKSGRRRRIVYPTKRGESQPMPFDESELAPSLRGNRDEMVDVDLELRGGKPVRIRPRGAPWQGGAPYHATAQQTRREVAQDRKFRNPYNFVPTMPRDKVQGELGDHKPPGHQRYEPERWWGRIRVRLTVETPLLIPDASRMEEDPNGHKRFPVRVGPDGKPYLAPTSVKGMLRSAYEAITNSRLSVFSKHGDRLAYRKPDIRGKSQYPASPLELLHPTLRPAGTLDQLSPADRVFGWVRQEQGAPGVGAYRGHLRVGPVVCEQSAEQAITSFEPDGVPLAVLSAPKPQQARFYVGKNVNGAPCAQDNGLSLEDVGYQRGKLLRGRKVYPHHAGLPGGYWNNPTDDRTQQPLNGHFQEYRRPSGDKERDDQNRSMLGWVNPGTTFVFDCWVTNLSRVELGALLWLLTLPQGCYHRFGGGKPLGFGSVLLDLVPEESDLRTGADWREHYRSLGGSRAAQPDWPGLVDAYRKEVEKTYGNGDPFDQVPFIAAFLRAARGWDDGVPIHYPRSTGRPDPAGRQFDWFVANEVPDQRLTLPDLDSDSVLPILQKKSGPGGGGSPRGRWEPAGAPLDRR